MGTSVNPLGESIVSTSLIAESPPSIDVDGTLGDNDWYVSDVTITFTIYANVSYIMYRLDGGAWQEYDGPITVCEDGIHLICWFYVDNQGNESEVECIEFKIDQTPPTITISFEQIDSTKWKVIADVSDETSRVERVEFYLDDKLEETDTEAPFEWELTGIGMGHVVQAIVYDNAGNYCISCHLPPIPPTRVFGIIRNPEFNGEYVSFFAIVVVSNTCPTCIRRQLTLQNDYSGRIGKFFINAVFKYGPL